MHISMYIMQWAPHKHVLCRWLDILQICYYGSAFSASSSTHHKRWHKRTIKCDMGRMERCCSFAASFISAADAGRNYCGRSVELACLLTWYVITGAAQSQPYTMYIWCTCADWHQSPSKFHNSSLPKLHHPCDRASSFLVQYFKCS